MKGINKVSPALGQFLRKGQKNGLNIKEGFEFLKKQMTPKEESAQDNRNIIEQESPELHQFIDQEVRKGRKPIEAGAIAQSDKRFMDIIKKLVKTHKTPWSNILESIYGGQGMAQPQQAQQQQMQQPQAPQQGQQQGMSDADLLAAIERTLKL
jgi:hypothetical protein